MLLRPSGARLESSWQRLADVAIFIVFCTEILIFSRSRGLFWRHFGALRGILVLFEGSWSVLKRLWRLLRSLRNLLRRLKSVLRAVLGGPWAVLGCLGRQVGSKLGPKVMLFGIDFLTDFNGFGMAKMGLDWEPN